MKRTDPTDHAEDSNDTSSIVKKHGIAQQYRVSLRTVEYWMKNGIIPFIKISRCVRFDKRKVADAIARYEKEAN